MRGVTSIAVAFGLLALASWTFSQKGLSMGVFVLGAVALVLFVRGTQGNGIKAAAGDANGAADFISNPSGAIVESAIDSIGGLIKEQRDKPAAESSFDADAAIARYLANRPEPLSGAADPAPARPQFGRKGL